METKKTFYYVLFFDSSQFWPWIIFGNSFQCSEHTGDVVQVILRKDICTCNYPNPKIPRSNQGC
jgi:hypothetical protein